MLQLPLVVLLEQHRADPPNERPKALEPNVGILLYLVSLGFVAIATVVVFFGVGFLLLAHRNEELIAGPDARNRVSKSNPDPDLASLFILLAGQIVESFVTGAAGPANRIYKWLSN